MILLFVGRNSRRIILFYCTFNHILLHVTVKYMFFQFHISRECKSAGSPLPRSDCCWSSWGCWTGSGWNMSNILKCSSDPRRPASQKHNQPAWTVSVWILIYISFIFISFSPLHSLHFKMWLPHGRNSSLPSEPVYLALMKLSPAQRCSSWPWSQLVLIAITGLTLV